LSFLILFAALKRSQKFWQTLESRSITIGSVGDPLETRYSSLALGQTVRAQAWRSQKFWGRWGWDGDRLETCFFPAFLTAPISAILGQTVIMEICQKLTPCVSLFKVIRTDSDRLASYDFLLVIRSNHGPMSYCFRDKWRFRTKIANFPPTPCM